MTTVAGRRGRRTHGSLGIGLLMLGAGAVPALRAPAAAAATGPAPAAVAEPAEAAEPGEPRQAPSPPKRFKLGIELVTNFRHSEDTDFERGPAYPLEQTVDPGSHVEVSNVALLADYDPSPLWHAHLRFNGVNLYYRNPTSTDHQYD